MKYTLNINQKAIVDLGFQDKLDFIDLSIYDFITDFMLCEDCNKINIGNEQYFWIKADLIIENLPLLGISTTRGVNKRIEKLIECELLERCPENQSLRQSFFKVGRLYKGYKFSTWNENSKPSWNENSKYNNNNIDKKREIEDKSSIERERRFVKPTIEEIQTHIQQKGYTFDAEEFYAHYESNGWRVGQNKMKDWKAACVTWARKRNNNNNNNYGRETISDKIKRTAKQATAFKQKLDEEIERQANMDVGDEENVWWLPET